MYNHCTKKEGSTQNAVRRMSRRTSSTIGTTVKDVLSFQGFVMQGASANSNSGRATVHCAEEDLDMAQSVLKGSVYG